MKITAIYDNGGETFDRFTILTDEPFNERLYPKEVVNSLGMSNDGVGYSQWGSASAGAHLGKKVHFEDLSQEAQNHIARRIYNEVN